MTAVYGSLLSTLVLLAAMVLPGPARAQQKGASSYKDVVPGLAAVTAKNQVYKARVVLRDSLAEAQKVMAGTKFLDVAYEEAKQRLQTREAINYAATGCAALSFSPVVTPEFSFDGIGGSNARRSASFLIAPCSATRASVSRSLDVQSSIALCARRSASCGQ